MRNTKRVLSMILVVCMLLSVLPLSAFAVTITDKPENGTTVGQPFLAGTGGSNNFRIPGIVTLNDGTLIAACDARWNHSGDGAGLDTIVSVSTDNGANWTYTFANYLGDNGNTYNNLSTCIIDPGIGTDGTTAYLIADLWPAGIALNTSKYGPIAGENGFDDNNNLLLRLLAEDTVAIGADGYNTMAGTVSRYTHYLDLETLELYAYGADGAEDTKIEGYTVDAYFNIVSDDGTLSTNLFFADSPFQPYPTDYLYMTTSTDGLEWSAPKLLNLKEEAEQTLLVGPGNGTYDAENDHMVFTAYEHTSGYERTSLIWQDTEGNWHRTADATIDTWSSEASAVILDDGTIRVFYRDGYSILRYTDYHWSAADNNYVRDPDATEVTTVAAKTVRCQLTAIKYSETIEGKEAIVVATPTASSRADGHVYVFVVEEDNTMTLAYDYDVIPNSSEYYAYSCITELENGDLGLLYEGDNPDTSGASEIIFTTIDMDDVVVRDNDARLSFVDVSLLTGETVTYTDNSGYYPNPDLSDLDTNVATVTVSGSETTTNAAQVLSTGANVDLDACRYTFTADGDYYVISNTVGDTTVYLNHYLTTNNNIPNLTTAGPVAVTNGTVEGMFRLESQVQEGGSGVARGLHFHAEATTPYWNRCGSDTTYKCQEYLFRKAEAGETAGSDIPGYIQLTDVSEIENGGQYLIAAKNDAGNWYVLNPATSTTSLDHIAKIMGSTTVGYTDVAITGVGAGYTEALVGSTVYRITAKNQATVEVTIPVGGTATYTQEGNYADADTSALDTNVATVTLVGSDGANDQGVAMTPVTTLADGTYVIVNTRANKLVTNASASAGAQAGTMAGFALSGNTTNVNADTAVWTIKAVDGGYTVQDVNGKYMTIGSNQGGLSDDAQVLTIVYTNGTWTLMQNNAYLNDAAGAGTTASGWQHADAFGDAGSQFDIYAYGESVPAAGTTVTFTGVYPGTTSVMIDRYLYNITVTGNVVDLEMDEGDTYAHVVNGSDVDISDYDEDVISVTSGTTLGGQLGSDTSYSGEYVSLADCLYTFTKGEDDRWTIVGTGADGSAVYLYPGNTTGTGYPHRAAEYANMSVFAGSEEGSIALMSNDCDNSNQSTSYLYFDRSNLRWDRVSSPGTNATWLTNTSVYLYRAVDGEGSDEIPGYEKVTSVDDVTDGEYLIAAPSNGTWYVAYPSTDTTTRYNQIAKVSETTAVVITAVGEGETTVRVEDTIFNITVSHTHSYTATVTEPTCTAGGYTTYTCSCGDSYVADETPALDHDFQDGTCTGCGTGIAWNETTDTTYTTLAEALAAAEAGQTVKLLGDCTESRVLVTNGVTLNLNGKTLTAQYMVGFKGAKIGGAGKVIVDKQNVVLAEDNGWLPVYGTDGYIFTQVATRIKQAEGYTGPGVKVNALAYMNNMDAVELLKDGGADNDVQIMILLSWDSADGTSTQKFVFKDEIVASVFNSNTGTITGYEKMFVMVITGIENVENLRASVVVVSATNVEYSDSEMLPLN